MLSTQRTAWITNSVQHRRAAFNFRSKDVPAARGRFGTCLSRSFASRRGVGTQGRPHRQRIPVAVHLLRPQLPAPAALEDQGERLRARVKALERRYQRRVVRHYYHPRRLDYLEPVAVKHAPLPSTGAARSTCAQRHTACTSVSLSRCHNLGVTMSRCQVTHVAPAAASARGNSRGSRSTREQKGHPHTYPRTPALGVPGLFARRTGMRAPYSAHPAPRSAVLKAGKVVYLRIVSASAPMRSGHLLGRVVYTPCRVWWALVALTLGLYWVWLGVV